MFVVALSLAGHLVPGTYAACIRSLDLHRQLDSAARSHGVSQPPALQCHAYAGCQSRHLAS